MSVLTTGPHSPEAEVSVLGACLQDFEAARKATELLTVGDFFDDRRGEIFVAVQFLVQRGIPPDLVTVHEELVRRGTLGRVVGGAYLAELVDQTPTAANVAHHAQLVLEKSNLRRILEVCTQTVKRVRTDGADLPEILADLRGELDRLQAPRATDCPVLVTLADVAPESVSWLWPGRLPRAKLSLLIGDPGEGKSCLTVDVAARVSCGQPWPDGGTAPLGGVVLLTAEDGLADTVRPRLDAMGADSRRVVALRGIQRSGEDSPTHFHLADDLEHLETAITHTDAVLVVVDPVSAYLGKTDSYRDSDVRGVLAPLAALAERTTAAIVAVMHLTKDAQRKVLYRAQGSLAFVAASRAVFTVAEDRDNPERRLFLPVKNNLGPRPPGLGFRLIPTGNAVRLEWDAEPVTVNADEALAGPEPAQERGERGEAKDFLLEVLSDGPVAATEVKRQAKAAGVAERTLIRARYDIKVKAVRVGGLGCDGRWQWELPDQSPKNAKDATSATYRHGGILGTLSKAEAPAEGEEEVPL